MPTLCVRKQRSASKRSALVYIYVYIYFSHPGWIRKFHRTHSSLITQIRSQLTALSLTLNQVDKGHGLAVLHKSTLTQIYRSYLRCETTRVPPVKYKADCDKLRNMLYDLDKNRKSYTDDRCPTLYFKYKTHKSIFKVEPVLSAAVYHIKIDIATLCRHTRPIVNHRPSLTTLCSDFFRPHLTPIIKNSVFLVEDVYETVSAVCINGHPSAIYSYDIQKFYPSTPHDLIMAAFAFFCPNQQMSLSPLLQALLNMNYVTDGHHFYHHGFTGIPMGLPLAPEISRMCTAYILKY